MIVPTADQPSDENWRYANLRPLAKARVEAVAAGSRRARIDAACPRCRGYERWVFVDGHFARRRCRRPRRFLRHACSNAREAGEEFAALLDAAIATEGVDFALARVNGARGDQVLHIAPPDDAQRAASN